MRDDTVSVGTWVSLVVAVIAILAVVIGMSASCTKVEPGFAGIKVNQYGSQRGVEDFPIVTGRVWYNPFTEEIKKFPTHLQTVVWTKDKTEGSPNDDSITFNSIEGSLINADISLSYSFEHDRVPAIYVEFKKEPEEITNVYMRSRVRDAFGRAGSTMQVIKIFGEEKQLLLDNVRMLLENELGPKGIKIDSVTFVGGLRLDPKVETAINAVIEANQRATEAEEKVRQATAEARQVKEAAAGEAAAILAVAEAQAEANLLVAQSVTPELIEWEKVQRWNGVVPQVNVGDGGAVPLIQIPTLRAGTQTPSGYIGGDK